MIAGMSIVRFLATSLVAALFGLAGMEAVMTLIARRGWAEGNMVIAVGSLFTRKRENAFVTGAILHATTALCFAMLYLSLMLKFGFTRSSSAFAAGIAFGIIHGMIVTLALVWVVSEQHPLEEFRDAGFAVGVSHMAAHVAYGALVGLVVGTSMS